MDYYLYKFDKEESFTQEIIENISNLFKKDYY